VEEVGEERNQEEAVENKNVKYSEGNNRERMWWWRGFYLQL
jgi:hypothetical protein